MLTYSTAAPYFADYMSAKPVPQPRRLLPSRALVEDHGLQPNENSVNHSYDRATAAAIHPAVEISPSEIVTRQTMMWPGMAVEFIQLTAYDKVEFRFYAPVHLLAAYEQGVRRGGETFIEGLPPSKLRDLARKFTLTPAGHEYREWHEPGTLTRLTYVYFDPAKLQTNCELNIADAPFTPRLFFEDPTLWSTVVKLKRLAESQSPANQLYVEALGIVLVHELMRLDRGSPRVDPPTRGGLAPWQQRTAIDYIEEHLAEAIPLSAFAQLVRLSPYYFCRAFKQSFGVPPHRYHMDRRIEHAKELLAQRVISVTDVGLTLGFSETSSFSAAFRKATGLTPSQYHRSVA
jgi:AraC family transcriptional regulator